MNINRPQKPRYNEGKVLAPWRETLNSIIFGSETCLGKTFDIILILSIICSVVAVMLGSVTNIQMQYGEILFYIEWFFTLLFTLEYTLRLISVRRPLFYARSFFGIVDFLSIIPTYLSFLFPSIKYMLVIRILRLLRVFRILKLSAYMGEAQTLMSALNKSWRKILVFLYTILTLVVIFGSLMYVVEGSEAGFTSIPKSVYWAIVTLTTVGYGDIAPQTPLGQMIAAFIMIMGYGIIAVPTGIYSAELIKTYKPERISNDACSACGETGHDFDAEFCKYCGHSLED
ncbi:MAG: ion transporter [Methylococcales bacterium]|nr:ion transporter [Methylococcales bacterium]MCK5478459.1 ion transporter [Methylococcales bacterium]